MNFTACLFDFDGTLAANEILKGQALAQTCHALGAQANRDLYKNVMGQRWEDVRDYFCKIYEIPPCPVEFDHLFKNFYENLLAAQLQPTTGVVELIYRLRAQRKKIAVVSSANRWMVERSLELLSLEEKFDLTITREDVHTHKPAPEAYLLALHKLAVPAKDALIFEDSEAGIRAGVAAGCRVIAIRHDFNGKQNLQLAHRTIGNFTEFIDS